MVVDPLLDCSLLYSQCLAHRSVPLITVQWMSKRQHCRILSQNLLADRGSSSPCTCPMSRNALSQSNHFSTGLLENSFKFYFKTLTWNIDLLVWPTMWPSYLMANDHVACSFLPLVPLLSLGLDTHQFVIALDTCGIWRWSSDSLSRPPPSHTLRAHSV